MAVGWTKKNVAAMADTLDQDYIDIEGAAIAALDKAMELLEERGKFAVVGQVVATREDGKIPPDHPQAVKVCLGLFDSDTKANDAAGALTFSTSSGDQLATWVVPMFYGTPAGWHGEQRQAYAALAAKADDKRREKLRASIAKHAAQAESRAIAIHAMEERAGQQWPCPSTAIKAGKCLHDPTCK